MRFVQLLLCLTNTFTKYLTLIYFLKLVTIAYEQLPDEDTWVSKQFTVKRNEQVLTNTVCICWFNVLEIALCMFQKHLPCFHSRLQSLWTYLTRTAKACVACSALGSRQQSFGTTQRTAFSPSTWTRLREVIEVYRLSQLQAVAEHRSFCVAVY